MKNINTEVEKTLQSWDNIERFEANPFLYTRLEQEIKNLEIPPKVNRIWFWQPLLVAVILVLNFFTIVTALNSETNESQTVYDAIAEQYNLSTDSETNFELY
ncbi:MAG: hypothetical protein ACI97N_001707 [Cognaticolwellia sp.]|jgi:hypothetical protein|tara:strand:+ start:895 stop:1200 length:306 start_codon:yes stop_codon:yes gene_type:complete